MLPASASKAQFSPPLYGVIFYWFSCIGVLLGFVWSSPLSWILLSCIVPVFYGAHEALHQTLTPCGWPRRLRHAHTALALLVGFALQGMNFTLLRPAHMRHHIYGRDDYGYAPDRLSGPPRLRDVVLYYLRLMGPVAFYWQAVGFLAVLLPHRLMPYSRYPEFATRPRCSPFLISQLAVAGFFGFALIVGGVFKILLFDLAFCLVWSMCQNVSHYGLTGIDEETRRVCARTYVLESPFRLLTFGSTAHLPHHVDMSIPGPFLHEPYIIRSVERRLGLKIEIKYGVIEFLKDVLRQLKGPVQEQMLSIGWIRDAPPDHV